MNSFLKRQPRTNSKRKDTSPSSEASSSSSTSSLFNACTILAPKQKQQQQLHIIVEDSEELSDSPRPSFSSSRSTPDRKRPNINDIRLPQKRRSEENFLANETMLSAPRPAPRPPSPLSTRSVSPALTRSLSPLPQSVLTRLTTPSPPSSPDAHHFLFPMHSSHCPTQTGPSPFSSPSSVSSGLPVTPDESPFPSPRLGPYPSSSSSQLMRIKSIKPLNIVKKNDLTFDTFFSSPITPSSASFSSSDRDEDLLMSLEPISFALPTSPMVAKASCDPLTVVPSLQPPRHYEQDSDEEEEFYASSVSSLITLRTAMPQKHSIPNSRPESIASPPQPRFRMSKPLPDLPLSPISDESGSRKMCFPSAQLDPAWGRRSFLIPSRPPPLPPASTSSSSALEPSVPTLRKSRPPSLTLTKPLPRSSIVPSDEIDIDGSSVVSYYGVSPFVDSDYLPTHRSESSCSSSSTHFSESSRSEASSLPTSPSSEGGEHVEDHDISGLELELDAFDLQFDIDNTLDDLDHFDMESDLRLPVSLPGSPVPFTPVEEDLDAMFAARQNQSDVEAPATDKKVPVLRSQWSSSSLGSIKSPRLPSDSAVSKFKLYFRNHAASTSTLSKQKRRRSVVIVGPSAPSAGVSVKRRSTAASLTFIPPRTPKSSRSTVSSFNFDTPLSPTFPSPTEASTRLSPAVLRRLGAEAALSTTSPAALRRLGVAADGTDEKKLKRRTSSSSMVSHGSGLSTGSEKKRKPIPIEMFLRA